MGPSNNLAYLIQHLSSVMGRQSDRVLKEDLDIGLSQFRILMVLEWNPRVSQRSIADSLGQTEAAISRQIKTLVSKGLLVSKPAPGNRRRQVIAPTTRGMQVTESANDILRRELESNLSRLGHEEVAQLMSGLQNLHRAVCRPGKVGACDHRLGF